MKKIIPLLLLLLLLLPTLTACKKSAFDHPEDYVSLPPFSEIIVTGAEVDKAMKELEDEILEKLTGEYFTPITDRNETIRRGDKATIRYTGRPTSSASLSKEAEAALNSGEKDFDLVIGSGTLPEKVENALLDKKAGEKVTVKVTYTEDDTDIKDLIDREVELTIDIRSIARLSVTPRHVVKLQFSASLPEGMEPTKEIKKLLDGGVETIDLADEEDSFDTVFTPAELTPHLVGHGKYDKIEFTLTLDRERASKYGYDSELPIVFSVEIREAKEEPETLTDALVAESTGGAYTTVADYRVFCLNMVKEELALQAVSHAAVYTEDLPKKEYDAFYEENYNAALYSILGDVSGYTAEQLAAMMSEEVANKINETAHNNTLIELRERLLLEYLFDHFNLSLTKAEYNAKLKELFELYQTNNYYMLVYYGIDTPEKLEDFIGREYAEVQFLYERLMPLIKESVTFTD